MSQSIIQAEVTKAIIVNNYNGIVIAAMRSGKSKMIIDALKQFKGSVLWITDKVRLRDVDIPREFVLWGGNIANVDIICYSSTNKIDKVYDLIILDECQRITINNYNHIRDKYVNILACTGTMPVRKSKLDIYKALNLNIIYELTVDEAVAAKIVAPYEIQIWNHKLNRVDKNVKISYKAHDGKQKEFYTTEFARYDYLTNRIEYTKRMGRNTKFLNLNRMRFIGKLPTKEEITSNYLAQNQHKRILVFCSDIDQATRITPLSYHSKTDDSCLSAFVAGTINHLSVVNMVDTGMTFRNIDEIFIITSNSSNIQTVQRIGRSLMYKPDYIAKIIILCAEETVEKIWIKKALEDLDHANVQEINWP